MSLTALSQFAQSTYSQFGEDVIVCEILKGVEGKGAKQDYEKNQKEIKVIGIEMCMWGMLREC